MSNSSRNMSTTNAEVVDLFVTYYPLILIIVGTLFNSFTFAILWRPIFRDTNKRPSIHYMRAIAIFDIFMLYGWNFDHYLDGAYGFTLPRLSIPLCRFMSFYNYFSGQSSAWLRVFVSFDRYVSLSRLHKTWFSQSKNVLIIIGCIIGVCILINGLFLFYGCSRRANGTVSVYSWAFKVYPLWDYINLGIYNCVPFILMVIFNTGVIYHLIHLRQTSTVQNSRIQHRSISITLVITTFLFSIMTIPATVCYGFFASTAGYVILHLFDSILYTYHILSFPLYMITFHEFRQEVFRLIIPNRWHGIQLIGFQLKERIKQ